MRAVPCPVSPETLRDLYAVQKQTDQEIVEHLCAQGYGATLKRVRAWRQRFGIDTVPRWARHEVTPIEGTLRSLLVGSMLGDGRLVHRTKATHYEESHAGNQLDYLKWKAEVWGSAWVRDLREVPDTRGFRTYRMWTHAHASLNEWQALFYASREKGWKRFLPEVADLVDPFALAVWFLDDGHAGWWPEFAFGADEPSRQVALAALDRFGLHPRWLPLKGNTGKFILEGEAQAEHFLALVRPFVPACMSYKLDFGFLGRGYQMRQVMDEAVLRRLAGEGVPLRDMARRLGVGASTVSRWLRALGVEHPRKVGRPRLNTLAR